MHQLIKALGTAPVLPEMIYCVIQAIAIKGTIDISLSPFAYGIGFWDHTLLLHRFIVVYLKCWYVLFFMSEFMEAFRVEG